MIKLLHLIKKNFTRLVSSKVSIMAVILAPLLLILFVGLAFSGTSFFDVNIGLVYNFDSETEFIDNFNNIIETLDFQILNFEKKQECLDKITEGGIILCIYIPEELGQEEIEIIVDQSRVNLANLILFKISGQIDILTEDMSFEITEGILNSLRQASQDISSRSENFNYLTEDLNELQLILSNINSQLDEFDVSDRYFLLQALQDPSSDFQRNLNNARTDLNVILADVDEAIIFLEQASSLAEDANKEFEDAYNTLSCEQYELFNLLDQSKDLIEIIEKTEMPICSFLFTFIEDFKSRKNELDHIHDDFKDVRISILKYLDELDLAEELIQTEVDTIEQDFENIEQGKEGVQTDLANLERILNQSGSQIDNVKVELLGLGSSLSDISNIDVESIINPLRTKTNYASDNNYTYLDFLFPGLLSLIVMYMGILLGLIITSKEITSPAKFRNVVSPVGNILFLVSIFITALVLVFVQTLILIGMAKLFFGTILMIDSLVLLKIFLFSLIFISIGIIIGSLVSSQEIAIILGICLSSVFLIFSDLLVPLETMQRFVFFLAKFSPFNIAEMVFRRNFFYGIDLLSLDISFLIVLFIQITVLFGLSYFLFNKKMSKV